MPGHDPYVRVSSAMYPVRERFDGWREDFARRVLNLDVVRHGAGVFHSDVKVLTDGVCSLGEASTSSCTTQRTKGLIGDGRDDLFLFQPAQGSLTCGRDGNDDFVAHPGGLAFQRTDEVGHLRHNEAEGVNRYEWIHVPAAKLAGRVRNLADLRGREIAERLAANSSRVSLLTSYADFVRSNASRADAGGIHAMMEHIADLTALALGPAPGEMDRIEMGGLRAARYRRLIKELERRFSDPDMNAHRLGLTVGISDRYVQAVFQAAETTLTDELARIRLERARQMLTDGPREVLVAEVALACGFSDLTHFNRSFKRRFGMTPREMRGGA